MAEKKGLLGKIMEHITPENDPAHGDFKEDVYHEHKGLLGKVMPHIAPKDEVKDVPPPGGRQ